MLKHQLQQLDLRFEQVNKLQVITKVFTFSGTEIVKFSNALLKLTSEEEQFQHGINHMQIDFNLSIDGRS